MKYNRNMANDPYLSKSYAKPDKQAKSVSQSMPFELTHNIFVAIPDTEIDAQANHDYTVIQLDYFPHSPLASMSRSQQYKAARKP